MYCVSPLTGLQGLRRQLLRPKPAADLLLAELFAASPHFQELHAIWEVQVSAKDLLVALELCSLCTTLLRYRPSPSCSSNVKQAIQQGQDHLAASILQKRLKAIYFHLSSSNRARSNAAFALLTAISNRGGSVLRELASSFDFSLSVLPKLARPPRALTAAQEAAAASDAAAAAAVAGEQPGHWLTWNSPQLSKRPSRAMFVGWGEYLGVVDTCVAHMCTGKHIESACLVELVWTSRLKQHKHMPWQKRMHYIRMCVPKTGFMY
jgi:hypothetical protein